MRNAQVEAELRIEAREALVDHRNDTLGAKPVAVLREGGAAFSGRLPGGGCQGAASERHSQSEASRGPKRGRGLHSGCQGAALCPREGGAVPERRKEGALWKRSLVIPPTTEPYHFGEGALLAGAPLQERPIKGRSQPRTPRIPLLPAANSSDRRPASLWRVRASRRYKSELRRKGPSAASAARATAVRASSRPSWPPARAARSVCTAPAPAWRMSRWV